MSVSLRRLLPLFQHERAGGRVLVLATVVHTVGSTYTKPGAMMLIAESGEFAGLLSGGCLEGDLAERARAVFEYGGPQLARYDTRGPDDLLFGLGSGCEGSMDILLQRLDAAYDWQPMTRLASAYHARRSETLLLVVSTQIESMEIGSGIFLGDAEIFGVSGAKRMRTGVAQSAWAELAARGAELPLFGPSRFMPQALPGVDLLLLCQRPAPSILLLGAGPDAQPVAELALFLGWDVSVIDHRTHYAQPQRFAGARLVLDGGPQAAIAFLRNEAMSTVPLSAAIVMSHNMAMDHGYLAALEPSKVPYIGLLGPATRRERLLTELGTMGQSLRPRLHSPAGLNLGAATPEAIALSIIAEIQAILSGYGRTESLSAMPLATRAITEAASDIDERQIRTAPRRVRPNQGAP